MRPSTTIYQAQGTHLSASAHQRAFSSTKCARTTRTAACSTRRHQISVTDSSKQSSPTQISATQSTFSRRELAAMVATAISLPQLMQAMPAVAAEQTYVDPQDAFELAVPTGWQTSEGVLEGNRSFTGASGARRTIAWYPSDTPADQVNVTLTITNTSVEFTKLGSFGNVFAFGTNLVNSMDRSFLLRMRGPNAMPADGEPVQVAKLLDAKDTRGMYQLEYSVEKMPGPKRHLYSLVALAYNGRYNRLYTLTAQCLEEQVVQYEPVLLQVLSSFKPPEGVGSA